MIKENKFARFYNLAIITCGSFTAILGISVLFGWYSHNLQLIQIQPAYVPMTYNTALLFILCGLGLVAGASNRPLVTVALGGIVLAVGFLTLTEYLFKINIGIDEFLMKQYVTVKVSSPGRMAPNTALGFTFVGFCLMQIEKTLWSKKFRLLLGVLSSIIIALGAVPLFGYLAGLESAYGWGTLTRMAFHTSIGFVILGIGMMAFAGLEDQVEQKDKLKLIPALIGIGLVTATFLLWQSLNGQDMFTYEERTVIPEIVLAGGLLLTLLVVLSIYFALKAKLRTTQLEMINQALEKQIVERRQVSEALEKSKERSRLIIETANDAFVGMDARGLITDWNHHAEILFGWPKAEILGKPLAETIIPTQHREVYQKGLEQFLTTGNETFLNKRIEMIGLHRNGSEFPIEFKVWPIFEEGNINFSAFIHDIAERKRAEEERFKASKLESLAVLAGGIAHDFNNILTAIFGNISLAKLSLKPQDELFQRLSEAEKACLRAQALTQQLLTFAKGGAPVKRTTSLKEILKESAEFTLRGSNVRCEIRIVEDLWPVDIDEGQISRVIHNLVLNAQQAMPKGGVITIRAENKIFQLEEKRETPFPLQGKCVEIVISDQGGGISKENLEKIFDPYFSTKERGNGLGLAATYSILKNHNGHIAVESQIGVGTTFRIYFSASEGKIVKSTEQNLKPRKGLGKILVMDDEESIRALLQDLLGRLGYATDCTKDGDEAIARYQKAKETGSPFDIVIMDLTVPGGMGGREAIKKLREIDPRVKAIVSSGYASDLTTSELINQDGFNGVLSKPYRLDDLNHLLRDLLIASPKT